MASLGWALDGCKRAVASNWVCGRCAQMLGVSEGTLQSRSIGVARFSHAGQTASLNLFWLHIYGGGLWLPVCDQTNGKTTYDGGRYLFDTTNGANLGWRSGHYRRASDGKLFQLSADSASSRALRRSSDNLTLGVCARLRLGPA